MKSSFDNLCSVSFQLFIVWINLGLICGLCVGNDSDAIQILIAPVIALFLSAITGVNILYQGAISWPGVDERSWRSVISKLQLASIGSLIGVTLYPSLVRFLPGYEVWIIVLLCALSAVVFIVDIIVSVQSTVVRRKSTDV